MMNQVITLKFPGTAKPFSKEIAPPAIYKGVPIFSHPH
jgi:hypothetical protein